MNRRLSRRLPGSRNASFVSLNNTMSFVDDDSVDRAALPFPCCSVSRLPRLLRTPYAKRWRGTSTVPSVHGIHLAHGSAAPFHNEATQGRSCAHAILSPSLSLTSHARALRRAAAARAVQAHSEAAHVDSLDLVLGYEAELAGAHKPQRVLLTHIVVIIDHAVHFAARACGAQHRLAL